MSDSASPSKMMNLGRRDGIVFALLAGMVMIGYGGALDRYFTSEDFPILRVLMDEPVWLDLPELFSTPWFSIAVVEFYRPLSTLLLSIEVALFGTHHQYYNLVHVLVHVLNTILVYFIARLFAERDGSEARLLATVAAVIFALYPLHPNAVIFVASFATLFGASFFLASVLCYLLHDRSGRIPMLVVSLLGFLAALACYESAVTLPAVPIAYAVLTGSAGTRSLDARLFRASLFMAPLAGYFLLRKAVLDVFIGGYSTLFSGDYFPGLLDALWRLGTSVVLLLHPALPTTPITFAPPIALGLAVLVVLGVSAAYCFWRWLKGERRYAPVCLVSAVWALSSFAPYGFAVVVPLVGRYAYLASAGLALYLSFLTALLLPAPTWRRTGLLGLAVLFAGYYGVLLKQDLLYYELTGATARSFQAQTQHLPERGSETEYVFIGDYPRLLRDDQVPVSYFFEWGLNEAVNPPFTDSSLAVYPLPQIHGEVPLAIVASVPDAAVYAWDTPRSLLRKLDPSPALAKLEAGLPRIEVFYPPDGGEIPLSEEDLRIDFRPPAELHDLRLVLSSMSSQLALPISLEGDVTRHSAHFPFWLADLSRRLHPGSPIYYWLEARDAQQSVVAFSEMRSFFVGSK